MSNAMLCSLVVVLTGGCTQLHMAQMGAPLEDDHNVLTGGPVLGTTLNDLPASVLDTLKERVPDAEIADIARRTNNGLVYFRISFMEPPKNPTLYISEAGKAIEGFSK